MGLIGRDELLKFIKSNFVSSQSATLPQISKRFIDFSGIMFSKFIFVRSLTNIQDQVNNYTVEMANRFGKDIQVYCLMEGHAPRPKDLCRERVFKDSWAHGAEIRDACVPRIFEDQTFFIEKCNEYFPNDPEMERKFVNAWTYTSETRTSTFKYFVEGVLKSPYLFVKQLTFYGLGDKRNKVVHKTPEDVVWEEVSEDDLLPPEGEGKLAPAILQYCDPNDVILVSAVDSDALPYLLLRGQQFIDKKIEVWLDYDTKRWKKENSLTEKPADYLNITKLYSDLIQLYPNGTHWSYIATWFLPGWDFMFPHPPWIGPVKFFDKFRPGQALAALIPYKDGKFDLDHPKMLQMMLDLTYSVWKGAKTYRKMDTWDEEMLKVYLRKFWWTLQYATANRNKDIPDPMETRGGLSLFGWEYTEMKVLATARTVCDLPSKRKREEI
jgi:hypothetical protein